MKQYLIRMNEELYKRIKERAKFYGMSTNKMIIRYLEIGYIEDLKCGNSFYNNKNKRRSL